MSAHARLGPSNKRWPFCPGSVREEAPYEDVPSAAAIDGTGSHLLLEMCLQNNCLAINYDQQIIGANHPDNPMGWLVDNARIDRVQMCLDYVARRVRELTAQYPHSKVTVEAESKSDPGGMFGRDDWWGTVDITITVTNTHGACLFLEVCDYKDGRGYVSEKENSQLESYLGGRLRKFIASGPQLVRPFQTDRVQSDCRMTIVQPKTNPVVRYQEKSAADVMAKLEVLSAAARATDDPNAPLIPDKKGGKGHCQWCKHKPNCVAVNGAGIEAVKTMVTDLASTGDKPLFELLENAVSNITEIPEETLSSLLDTRPAVDAIYEKIKVEVQTRIEAGRSVPGYAMEAGNGSNKWNKPEEEIAKMLKGRRLKKDEIYPAKLISPAQVMKLKQLADDQKARIEKDHISYVAGKKTLKKVAHEPKAEKVVENMFDAVPQSAEELFATVEETVGQSETTVQQSEPTTEEVSFF